MSPVPEAVADNPPSAPQPGRLKDLFTRSRSTSAAATTDTSAPPPRSSSDKDLASPSTPLSPTSPTTPTGARSKLRTLFADSTRPATKAVRALGHGFPSAGPSRDRDRGASSSSAAAANASSPTSPVDEAAPQRSTGFSPPFWRNASASASRLHLTLPSVAPPHGLRLSRSGQNLGQSLAKGSKSTSALPLPTKGNGKEREVVEELAPRAKDDAEPTKTKRKGRHSLALLFQPRNRTVSAPSPSIAKSPTGPPDPPGAIPETLQSSVSDAEEVLSDGPHGDGEQLDEQLPALDPRPQPESNTATSPYLTRRFPEGKGPSPALVPRTLSNPPSLSALRPLSRPSSQSQLRPSESSSLRGPPNTLYNSYRSPGSGPYSSSPLVSPVGMSRSTSNLTQSRTSLHNVSRTSLSLSQTSLILPETGPHSQQLSKDHYHLRFATTYVTSLLTPALRNANFSKSERNMEIKRISEDRLGLLTRMERTWGSSWAEAAADLLVGTQSETEIIEAKLRACNITATAKARERKVFVTAMRDGILLCFLFNRLFPNQPPHIQRVKVPKDDVRISANLDRFLSACRNVGCPESEMFTMADLDEHSPAGLAHVSRLILCLAQMSGPSILARARVSSRLNTSHSRQASDSHSQKAPSQPASPRASSPRLGAATGSALATRTVGDRPLRSSSSDLIARLQREAGSAGTSSNTGSVSSTGAPAPSAGMASAPVSTGVANPPTSGLANATTAVRPGAATPPAEVVNTVTPPTPRPPQPLNPPRPRSPVRAIPTPSIPARATNSHNGTPPMARPQQRAINVNRGTAVSFASDSSSQHVSSLDWSSSISSNHSSNLLSPLQERERTPSLISNSSAMASMYSVNGSVVPTIVSDDQRPGDTEEEFDPSSPNLNDASSSTSQLVSPQDRRHSEQTLQQARRRIIGTLLSSTEDLTAQSGSRVGSLEEARGFALSQSLAALEGSRPLGKQRSESPRLRPISRGPLTPSIELQDRVEEETTSSHRLAPRTTELPPRPRIRRLSTNGGKIFVPKRTNSPASPNLSLQGPIFSPGLPTAPESYSTGRVTSREERRRSEDYPNRGVSSANTTRIMNMRNHSMINLPSNRRTSGLSQASRESTTQMAAQVLDFTEPGHPPVRYQLGNCIGRGQFGSVYRSLNLSTGQMVAIKRIRLSGMKEDEVHDVMREVELLKRLTHPGIVKYEGMSRDDKFLNIVLEFVENGSLGQTLRAFGRFNERLVASYVAKILEGLHYLHSEGVVHCDLKAANILSTKNGNVKLSDFGVSLNMRAVENFAERASIGKAEGRGLSGEIAGTPNWMAPEVIKLSGASPASDIWSLGCTIIELLTGRPPYSDVPNSMTVLFRIVEDPMPPLPETSAELCDFLKLCFIKDPKDRPSAALLFRHEWVGKGHPDLVSRPQDSLPFLRRLSQEPAVRRVDSQTLFKPGTDDPHPRSASASLIDLHAPRQGMPEGTNKAQMSMVSLHSHVGPGQTTREFHRDEPSVASEHSLVKTTFAKSITCHVCLEPLKKSALLCTNCGLISHSKCAVRANPRCDVREHLQLLAARPWAASSPTSRTGSPYPDGSSSSTINHGLALFPARLFNRNRSKNSLRAAASTSSLVHDNGTATLGSPSASASSGATPTPTPTMPGHSSAPETVSSLRSRHSETSEDGGSIHASTGPRDGRSSSLLRIDEDGPATRNPVVRVQEPQLPLRTMPPPVENTAPRKRTSMRLLPKASKPNLEQEKDKDKDCVLM